MFQEPETGIVVVRRSQITLKTICHSSLQGIERSANPELQLAIVPQDVLQDLESFGFPQEYAVRCHSLSRAGLGYDFRTYDTQVDASRVNSRMHRRKFRIQ